MPNYGSDPAEMRFEPTGDLTKDYSAYCEIEDKDEREEILDGISTTELDNGKGVKTTVVVRNLDYCLNKRDAAPLTNAIPHCNSLFSVQLTSCGVTEHTYKLLVEAIYKSPSIVSFAVDFNPNGLFKDPTATRKDKNDIVVMPSQFRGAHLKANEPESKEEGGKKGGKVDPKKLAAAKQQAAEEQAALDRTPIQLPTGWSAIFYTGLQQLSLRGNDINDKQIDQLAPILEKNNDLVSLSLWGNSITDSGAATLAASLAKNRRLTALNLGHNKIGDAGLEALANCFLTMDVTLEDALVARQRVYPNDKELPSYPSFSDLYALAAAAHGAGDDAKKDPKKKEPAKGKGKGAEGPIERHKNDFDKDCVKLEDGKLRIPGMTSLWCLNLSYNTAITAAGMETFVSVLKSHEPNYDDKEFVASATASGGDVGAAASPPPHYAGGLALEKVVIDHPSMDAVLKTKLADALAENIAARQSRPSTS